MRGEKRGNTVEEIIRIMCAGLLAAVAVFFMPLLLSEPPEPPAPEREEAPPAAAPRDSRRSVRLLGEDGRAEELNMEEYLWRVVAAEMPASFEPEALKAQACAARTYAVCLQNAPVPKHEGGALCGKSGCCQACITREEARERWGASAEEYTRKIARAVAETDGLGVLYQGKPIQAVFFSSAPGRTRDAVEVWGNKVDYLRPVDSPEGEEVPGYVTSQELSAREVKERVLARCPGARLVGGPEEWLRELEYDGSGCVEQGNLGGVVMTGSQIRQILGLRSAAFTVEQKGEQFIFKTRGYGHGVGMSQYGANAMAKEGKTFREILKWYYTSTEVGLLWS